jgi:hypothetical protein
MGRGEREHIELGQFCEGQSDALSGRYPSESFKESSR